MNRKILISALVLLPFMVNAQLYEASILQYRQAYKMSLMKGEDSLTAVDTGYLRFYEPDPAYQVKATFEQVTGTAPFRLGTKHGGKGAEVREYGIVYFNMNGAPITLHVYRMISKPKFRVLARAINNPDEEMVLFIPFTDRTNNKETFLGGRYLDVSNVNFQGGNVIIDFNKACNPHTAYEKGYPYILMPDIQGKGKAAQKPDIPNRNPFSSPEPGQGDLRAQQQNAIRKPTGQTDEQINSVIEQVNAIPIEIKAGEKVFGHDPGY